MNPERVDSVNVYRYKSVETPFYLNTILSYCIIILDFVNFLTFDEFYNVKLVFYSVKLVSIALLLAVGLSHTHTHNPLRGQTPSQKRNATYHNFTKLNGWRFLLARINRAVSHWSLSLAVDSL